MPKEEMATQRFETTIEGGSGGDEVSTQDITGRDVYSAPLLVDARAITFVMCRREKSRVGLQSQRGRWHQMQPT